MNAEEIQDPDRCAGCGKHMPGPKPQWHAESECHERQAKLRDPLALLSALEACQRERDQYRALCADAVAALDADVADPDSTGGRVWNAVCGVRKALIAAGAQEPGKADDGR